jgi:hypothetical protein
MSSVQVLPFVGRSHETRLFREALVARRGGFVLAIEGPTGIGKQALLEHYAQLSAEQADSVTTVTMRLLPCAGLTANLLEAERLLGEACKGRLRFSAGKSIEFVKSELARIIDRHRPEIIGPQTAATSLPVIFRRSLENAGSMFAPGELLVFLLVDDYGLLAEAHYDKFLESLASLPDSILFVVATPTDKLMAHGVSSKQVRLGPMQQSDVHRLAASIGQMAHLTHAHLGRLAWDCFAGETLPTSGLLRFFALNEGRSQRPIASGVQLSLEEVFEHSYTSLNDSERAIAGALAVQQLPLTPRELCDILGWASDSLSLLTREGSSMGWLLRSWPLDGASLILHHKLFADFVSRHTSPIMSRQYHLNSARL